MKIALKKIKYFLIISFSVLFILLSLFRLNFLDDKISDLIYKLKPSGPLPEDILMVWIDDQSLTQLNTTFPFNRKFFADAVLKLNQAGAKIIGIDSLLTESGVVKEGDEIFQKVLDQSKVPVILSSELSTEIPLKMPAFKVDSGLATVFKESDSYIRNFMPAFILPGSPKEYAFGVKILQKLGYAIEVDEKNLYYQNKTYALDEYGQYPITFFRKDYSEINFSALFSNQSNLSIVKDKVVIIAAAYESSKDFYHTPVSSIRLKGGEIHANIIEMFIKNQFIKKSTWLTNILILLFITFLFILKSVNSLEHYLLIPLILIIAPLSFFLFQYQVAVFLPIALTIILLLIQFIFYQKEMVLIKDRVIQDLKTAKNMIDRINLSPFDFTKREEAIIYLILKEKEITNNEIGKKLFISPATVKRHMVNIFEKIRQVKKDSKPTRNNLLDYLEEK